MSDSTVPVFISWSGEPSRIVANALATFINECIQAAQPWMSDNISKGEPWPDAILSKLQDSAIGIVCVTKANQTAPWLLFEGGALAKHKALHVFLIDAKPIEIKPPFSLYQTTLAERDDVLGLLQTIDAKLPDGMRRREKLKRACDTNWPDLEAAILRARELAGQATVPVRGDRELLEEILSIVRDTARESAAQAQRMFASALANGLIVTEGETDAWFLRALGRPSATSAEELWRFAQASSKPGSIAQTAAKIAAAAKKAEKEDPP